MKRIYTGAVLSALLTLPILGITQPAFASPRTKQDAQPVIGTMTGVVTSVDNSSMVLALPKSKGPGETLQLTSSTTGKSTVAVGNTVEVRFYFDNGRRVATSVAVKASPKSKASK